MTSPAIATPARRGRPGGRTAFQEEKRRQTRAAILKAAGEVLAATPYVYATIDDIIRAAGISRATFYTHFESKLALALAIYDGIAADWMDLFDGLAAMPGHDATALRAWLTALAALYVDHGYVTPLVAQLEIFEAGFRQRLRADRDALIARLAEAGVGGFTAARGEEGPRAHARAYLLLCRIDTLCGDIARGDTLSPVETDACMDLVVDELRGFIADRG